MEGWRGLHTVADQLSGLGDRPRRRPGGLLPRWDWLHDRYAARRVDVPPGPWLVVEGVGSGTPAVAAQVTVLVWVEVADTLRLARGMARDGDQLRAHWEQFMHDERALFAADRARERADVLVDGTGSRPPVVR